MGADLAFQCRCGAVKGVCRNAGPRAGVRARCYCGDCQAFAYFLGREDDMLDAAGGTDIYQTVASRFEITEGLEHVARVVVSPQGLNRWYASCCRTGLANTPAARGLPIVGTVAAIYDAAERERVLGPVAAIVFPKSAHGTPAPVAAKPMPVVFAGIIGRIAGEWLSGRVKIHPLYAAADAGRIGPPKVLTTDERAALDAKAAGRPPGRLA